MNVGRLVAIAQFRGIAIRFSVTRWAARAVRNAECRRDRAVACARAYDARPKPRRRGLPHRPGWSCPRRPPARSPRRRRRSLPGHAPERVWSNPTMWTASSGSMIDVASVDLDGDGDPESRLSSRDPTTAHSDSCRTHNLIRQTRRRPDHRYLDLPQWS
jgi:hypothetical protein